MRHRGRHLGGGHDLLGEGLAALELGGRGRRSEDGDPALAHHVRDAGDERDLGTDHDQVGLDLLRQVGDGRPVGRVGQGAAQGDLVDARVAGGGDDRVDGRVAQQGGDDGVLSGTGADDEDLHLAHPTGPRRSGREV
ncbi:hypothetical protein GCM10025862_28770 [Arsenicicoccus piscis]|uniref:Uncharacterized protein n=1 Tax=Arsenicicoccus piscis TaxID=673954 RepID=A0ABQ6HR66_9MICO|nr:hypothetical protein GCM10025862_28770 [Arsenicicoccus piscis]